MDNNKLYTGQSMDEMVFETRNKAYGAYTLRGEYHKHLLKALALSCSIFVFGLYSPKMVKSLGLFADKPEETLDTTTIVLTQPPSLKDEPPPPPPPPVQEVVRPTARFLEMQAVKKDEVTDPPPPTIDELQDKDIGKKNVDGDPTGDPPPVVDLGGGDIVDDKVYVNVDQKAEFIGGEDAFYQFLEDNLKYPEGPKADGITGVATVIFVVTQSGGVEDVRIERTAGNSELDEEAKRVLRKCSRMFKPGKNGGKPVKSIFRIPITFELEE